MSAPVDRALLGEMFAKADPDVLSEVAAVSKDHAEAVERWECATQLRFHC